MSARLHPSAPPRGAIAGATLVATLAATALILLGQDLWAGLACALATVLLACQGRLRLTPRGRFLDAASGFVFDATILAAVAWTMRGTAPGTAALLALSFSLFADYLVARARSLRYLMDDGIVTRAIRGILISFALLAGSIVALWMLVAVAFVTVLVRASQVPKRELAGG